MEREYNGSLPNEQDELIHIYDNLEFKVSDGILPEEFKIITPIRHQAWSNLCVSFAGAAMMYAWALKKYGRTEILSPTFTQNFCKEIDGHSSETGTTDSAWCQVVCKKGICDENLYPFDKKRTGTTKTYPTVPDIAIQNAKRNIAPGYGVVSTVEKIKDAIYNQSGCIASFTVFSNFEIDGAYIGDPGLVYEKPRGRHEMYICGYSDKHKHKLNGKEYTGFFIVQDSYGEETASKGYRYLAYDLVRENPFSAASGDRLINSIRTVYDASKLVNPNYHKEKMQSIKDCIDQKKSYIKLTIGSNVIDYNGQQKTILSAPIVKNGVTFVPIRVISELFGYQVYYDSSTKRIRIYDNYNKKDVYMWIGNKVAQNGGKEYIFLEPPYINNGSTMIPLRGVCDLFEKVIDWDSATKTITIFI